MKIAQFYSHLNGYEWLQFHHPDLWTEIRSIIEGVEAEKYRTKKSKEKTMKGRMLYSPEAMNEHYKEAFKKKGWSNDLVKERVAFEVQLGKYTFTVYDLFFKHLAFFVGDKIDLGIEILPMKSMQSEMAPGVGYYEVALCDLVRQGRGVPAVPLILVGVEP